MPPIQGQDAVDVQSLGHRQGDRVDEVQAAITVLPQDLLATAVVLRQWIQDWTTEQANVLEQELFAQTTRRVGAERALHARVTKKAQQDLRIASDKIARAGQRLKDLRRSEPLPRDSRIFPGSYSCVMVAEGGRRVVYPMRYQCRPQGKPAAVSYTHLTLPTSDLV